MIEPNTLAQRLKALLVDADEAGAAVTVAGTACPLQLTTFNATLANCLGASSCSAQVIVMPVGADYECIALLQMDASWSLATAYPESPAATLPLSGLKILLASCPSNATLPALDAFAIKLPGLTAFIKAGWQRGLNFSAAVAGTPFAKLPGGTGQSLVGVLSDDEYNDATLHLRGQLAGSPLDRIETLLEGFNANGTGILPMLEKAGLSDALKLVPLLEQSAQLLGSFTPKQIDVLASIWSDALATKARIQVSGTATFPLLPAGHQTLDAIVWWPLNSTQLFLRNRAPIKLPAITLPGGAAFPGVQRLLNAAVIREFVVGVSWRPIGLSCLWITFECNTEAPGVPATKLADLQLDFAITDVWVRLDVAPRPSVTAGIELQISEGEHIELRAMLPALIFSGRLKPGDSIDVTKLLASLAGKLGAKDGKAPPSWPKIDIEDLSIELDVTQKTCSLHLDVASAWRLSLGSQPPLLLQQVEFDLECGKDNLALTLQGTWSIPLRTDDPGSRGTLDVRVNAGYFGGSDWMISAQSVDDTRLPIGELIEHLATQFKEPGAPAWDCPPALKSLTAGNLSAAIELVGGKSVLRFHCETEWAFSGHPAALALTIQKDAGGGLSFNGKLAIGESQFDITFHAGAGAPPGLAAYYRHTGSAAVSLADLFGVMLTDAQVLDALSDVQVDLKQALLARADDKYLVAFLVDVKAAIGKLPLIGAELPADFSIGFQNVDVRFATDKIPAAALNLLQLPADMTLLGAPGAATDVEKGFSGTAELTFGGAVQTLRASSQPAPMAANAGPGNRGAVAGAPANPAGQQTSGPTWIPVQRSFGPFHLERIGVQFANAQAMLAFDAALSIAGLTVSLDALTLTTPINQFTPSFGLHGLGIDFHNDAVTIGGAFLKRDANSYGGAAVIELEDLAISAIGLYEEIDGHSSMCIYAVLDYPIGGPAFFFVTGLAAGFGYSRKLNLPSIERVGSFPLVSFAQRSAGAIVDLESDLKTLAQCIPPAIGEYFIGLGIRFSSFEIAESFALLTCSFGSHVEFNLLGVSTITAPPGVKEQPAARLELLLKGSLLPDAGFFGLQAQMTPNSFLLSNTCHLSGGFAFFSWFGASPHKGDFVLSVGGYHPVFAARKPAHYPDVPRLALNWQVDALSVKGQAYFALTPVAVMVGGSLEANWVSDSLHAWFKFAADMLLEWKPYHYLASASVEIGAELTFEFCGTHHLSAEVGAHLDIWGPEFSGKAVIDLTIISVQVAFGPTATDSTPQVLWKDFRAFLPKQVCSIAIASGTTVTGAAPKAGSVPTVDPHTLILIIDSALPAHQGVLLRTDQHKEYEDPIPATNQGSFELRPMGLSNRQFVSTQRIRVRRTVPGDNAAPAHDGGGDFSFDSPGKHVPRALWGGTPKEGEDAAIVKNVLTGWRMTPKPSTFGPTVDAVLGPDAIDFPDVWATPQQLDEPIDEFLKPGYASGP